MTKQPPLVSIVIPCYNHDKYVQESIQSVIDQDYDNIELIIIDDGSKDDSVTKIKEMIPACQQRFKRFEFRYRPNKGLCATLNEALAWCEGEFYSPLASDDIALNNKTSFLVDKISNSTYSAVFGLVSEFGNVTNISNATILDHTHTFEDLIRQKNVPAAPAVLLRTSSVKEVGGYMSDVKLEDWYMWLLLTSKNYKLKTFSEVVVLYRNHEDNTTKNVEGMFYSKVEVLNYFKNNSEYMAAKKTNLIVSAKQLATSNVLLPLKLLLQYKTLNSETIFVLIKIFTPKLFIRLKQKLIVYLRKQ